MHYPLGRLNDESALVEERHNNRITTEAILIQMAVHSLLAKEARKQFTKQLKQLNVTTKARPGLFDKE
jgi:hypothetical protein